MCRSCHTPLSLQVLHICQWISPLVYNKTKHWNQGVVSAQFPFRHLWTSGTTGTFYSKLTPWFALSYNPRVCCCWEWWGGNKPSQAKEDALCQNVLPYLSKQRGWKCPSEEKKHPELWLSASLLKPSWCLLRGPIIWDHQKRCLKKHPVWYTACAGVSLPARLMCRCCWIWYILVSHGFAGHLFYYIVIWDQKRKEQRREAKAAVPDYLFSAIAFDNFSMHRSQVCRLS